MVKNILTHSIFMKKKLVVRPRNAIKLKSKEELDLSVLSEEKSDDVASAKVVRKLDYTVLPIVTLFYFLSYLVRLPVIQFILDKFDRIEQT